VLREANLPFSLVRVDLRAHTTENGDDYYKINSKGAVPVLELDSGERLTEGSVICQFVADSAGNTVLMPAAGTMARYRVMEWQNYIGSEVHKAYSPLFHPAIDAAAKAIFRGVLRKKYEWVNERLGGSDYLTGSAFTAADAYLFTVTRWAKAMEVDLGGLAAIEGFMARVNARPAVRAAIAAETPAKSA
jgi:glutathione S-transferase